MRIIEDNLINKFLLKKKNILLYYNNTMSGGLMQLVAYGAQDILADLSLVTLTSVARLLP